MMHNRRTVVALAFLLRSSAKQFSAGAYGLDACIDSWVHALGDRYRSLQEQSRHSASLDSTMLGKPSSTDTVPRPHFQRPLPSVRRGGGADAAEPDFDSLNWTEVQERRKANSKHLKEWASNHSYVKVETPEDRELRAQERVALNSLAAGDTGTRTFKYVHIPSATNEPVSERTAVVFADARAKKGDQLPAILASEFESGTVEQEMLKHSPLHRLSGQIGDPNILNRITPEVLQRQGGATESFRLSNSVNMYMDEIGTLKMLPPNLRAAALAAKCGYGTGVTFPGDIFVGRVDAETGMNVDFKLEDMRDDAVWLRRATEENLVHQDKRGGGAGGMTAEEMSTRGGEGDGYEWTQDRSDVEVNVTAVPRGLRGKDIKVKFAADSVLVTAGPYNIHWDLFGKVSPADCSWSVVDGYLMLTLVKSVEDFMWLALLK
eukprot:gnl/TRDRNA2_/TRDRNA2_86380_c0_seq2.p1 gnl/TRDRNA2_/TRDRNA2_86380_c0~~gnl/TRDRNA2_/TRDRNA2_86380_c0_seq2.p1  ORF type:complete len:433 (+),score=52.75 gnl/TRDRNA2_/TRDRNA2_86380_c0_seq2:74-1372(+)